MLLKNLKGNHIMYGIADRNVFALLGCF